MNATVRLTKTDDGRIVIEVGLVEGQAFQSLMGVGMRREAFDAIVAGYLSESPIQPATMADVVALNRPTSAPIVNGQG